MNNDVTAVALHTHQFSLNKEGMKKLGKSL